MYKRKSVENQEVGLEIGVWIIKKKVRPKKKNWKRFCRSKDAKILVKWKSRGLQKGYIWRQVHPKGHWRRGERNHPTI